MEEKEIVLMMDGQPYADVIPIEYKGQRVIIRRRKPLGLPRG